MNLCERRCITVTMHRQYSSPAKEKYISFHSDLRKNTSKVIHLLNNTTELGGASNHLAKSNQLKNVKLLTCG